MQEDIQLYDIIIGQGASTNSDYVDQFQIPGHFSPLADFDLVVKGKKKQMQLVHVPT